MHNLSLSLSLYIYISKTPAAGHRRTPKHLPKNMARDDGVQGGNHCIPLSDTAEQRALSEEWCSDFRLELCTLCSFKIIEAHGGVLANFWNGMFVFVYSGYRAYSEKCWETWWNWRQFFMKACHMSEKNYWISIISVLTFRDFWGSGGCLETFSKRVRTKVSKHNCPQPAFESHV